MESKTTIKDLISLTTQKVILTIIEGYEIDELELGLSQEEIVAKRTIFLYRGLLES